MLKVLLLTLSLLPAPDFANIWRWYSASTIDNVNPSPSPDPNPTPNKLKPGDDCPKCVGGWLPTDGQVRLPCLKCKGDGICHEGDPILTDDLAAEDPDQEFKPLDTEERVKAAKEVPPAITPAKPAAQAPPVICPDCNGEGTLANEKSGAISVCEACQGDGRMTQSEYDNWIGGNTAQSSPENKPAPTSPTTPSKKYSYDTITYQGSTWTCLSDGNFWNAAKTHFLRPGNKDWRSAGAVQICNGTYCTLYPVSHSER